MSSFVGFIVGILQATLSLFGFAQPHPILPPPTEDQPIKVAQQAVTQATKAVTMDKDLQFSVSVDSPTQPLNVRAYLNISTQTEADLFLIDFGDGAKVSPELQCKGGIGSPGACGGGVAYHVYADSGSYLIKLIRDGITVETSTITLAKSAPSVPGMSTYTDPDFGFTINYSSDLRLQTPPLPPLGGWEYAFGKSDKLKAYISMIGTNKIGEGSVNINVSNDAADVQSCLADSLDPTVQSSSTTINGIQFAVFKNVPDMAGLTQSATYYKTLHKNNCYGIVDLRENILEGEKGNTLTADEAAKAQVDESEVNTKLSPTIQSFQFTD